MADNTPQRKSGRQRVPNRKYADDGLETLNKVLSSDSEDDLAVIQQLQEESNSDDEFPEDQLAIEPDDEDDSLADDASDDSAILTPVEEYEDAHSYASSDPGETIAPRQIKTTRRRENRYGDPSLHSRGMQETPIKTDSNRSRVELFAGGGIEDVFHIAKSRDQWAADPTLPRGSRLCRLFSHTEDKRRMEATVGWDWYYNEGGREEFARRQNTTRLSPDEATEYIPGAKGTSHTFLMGPYGGQKLFDFAPLQSLELFKALNYGSLPQNGDSKGWMLNAGSCVKCIDWAPNHDNTQYLALATGPPRHSSSFLASQSASSVQIWAIAAHSVAINPPMPELRTVLCSEWGPIQQLKWCPVPRNARGLGEDTLNIGLLAGIWSDGFARVVDVQIDQKSGLYPLKLDSACFTARVSGLLATCLTWLSATDLAIGHSDGQLAIFNIYENGNSDTPCLHNPAIPGISYPNTAANALPLEPVPWLSIGLHPSYILDLTSAYPTYPALLISTSASGNLRLTSLLAPMTDFVLSNRTRSPPSSVAYHDGLLSVVGMEESSETIRLWGLRCFYTSVGIGKLTGPPGPGASVMDVGKCHATVAAGSADGSVIVTNPMRKILGRREGGYQQCIFKHEWVRRPKAAGQEGQGERQGISRITEGYKAEEVRVGPKNKNGPTRELVMTTTIFEEETAVTALAWNPNVSCGGWLAVGWGSGLVRIQDVAI